MADSSTYTPETLQRRYAMAQALLADPKKPITHWAEGLNELAKGALGGYQMGNIERLEAKQRAGSVNDIIDAYKRDAAPSVGSGIAAPPAASMPVAPGGAPAPAPPPQVLGGGGAPAQPDAQGVYGADAVMMSPGGGAAPPDFGKAIAGIESAGQKDPYAALGPATRTGDRAYGKYQVMGANIPDWTKEHLGQEMTPQQFLANSQAQDAVFKGQFGKYVQQTGNPQDAASMWFSGKPLAQGAGLKDQLGTTGQQYVDKFNAGMGGAGASPAVGAIASALNGAQSGAPTGPVPTAPGALPDAGPSPAVAGVAKTLAAPAGAPATPLAGPAGVGANPNIAAIAKVLSNPWIDPAVKAQVLAQNSPSFGFQTLPDGTIVRTNPKTGQVEPIYQTPSKPQFVPNVSPNQYGVAQPGFVDPLNKKAFDISGNPITASPQATQNANPDVTGEDFLKTMPKAQADQIRGITEGRISPPGAFALKTPYWQKMLTDVAQYEPGFDLTKWGGRSATAKDFASGKSAQNITSFNTAISHLDTLDKAAEGLNNYSLTPINTIKNLVASKTGDPAIKNFDVAKNAVTDELTRAFRGSGGSVHDVKQWEDAINSANSPAQLKAAIKQATELLRGRIESLGDTYNRGMNTKTEAVQLLSPKAQKSLARLSGEGQPEPAPPAAAAGPAPKLGEEKEFKQGVGVWDGTKWVPKPTGGPSA